MTKKELIEKLAHIPDDREVMLMSSGGQTFRVVNGVCTDMDIDEYEGAERNGFWNPDNKPRYGQKPLRTFTVIVIW
jgi:hypothetical protein